MTPEGQKLWEQYSTIMGSLPDTRNIKFGGNTWTTPNRQKMGVLNSMLALDASRRGTLSTQPEQAGLLGKLF